MASINKAVLATAATTFIAFMGIGIVDPLLPLIGKNMGATPYQVEWLFTSYIAVMSVCMLLTAWLTNRFGAKRALLIGLGFVIVFSLLSGLSPNITIFAIFRGGWGFGNALFTSTALSIIVGVSAGTLNRSITLYEAALGLGIASGPLLGGLLGTFSWRDPFFGTSILMTAGLVFTLIAVKSPSNAHEKRSGRDVLMALRNREVRTNALISLGYSYGFFTILAYTPLTLVGLTTLQLGFTYFAWGVLLAISSVFLVNLLRQRVDAVTLLMLDLVFLITLFIALGRSPASVRLYLVVVSGVFTGIGNALFTTFAMEVSPFSRPVSSASYNFLRWSGAAIAPILSGYIGETYGLLVPFYISACVVAVATAFLFTRSETMRKSMGASSKPVAKKVA